VQPSAQELALAKALKPSKKSIAKTSAVGAEGAGTKKFYTSVGGNSVTRAPKCTLNLFGSDSSAFNGETAPLKQTHKRSKETPLARDMPKCSVLKGIFK
jgi:hypothetical protein